MNVVAIDLTGDALNFEAATFAKISRSMEDHGHVVRRFAANGFVEISTISKKLIGIVPDFTVLMAHGSNADDIGRIEFGMGRHGSLELLRQSLAQVLTGHKIFIVCEGMNSSSLAFFNSSLPRASVSADAALVAKTSEISATEAIEFCDVFFSRLGPNRPTPQEVERALNDAKRRSCQPDDWYMISAMKVDDE